MVSKEATYVKSIRSKALKVFKTLPFQKIHDSPTIRYYANWYFTEKLDIKSHVPTPSAVDKVLFSESSIKNSSCTIILNSIETKVIISDKNFYKNVKIIDLKTTSKEYEEIISRYVFRNIGINEGKIIAKHLAYWINGLIILVKDNTILEKPIRVILYSDHKHAHLGYHVVYIVGRNSKVHFDFVSMSGLGDSNVLKTIVVEGHVKSNSELNVTNVFMDKGFSYTYFLHRIRARSESAIRTFGYLYSKNVLHFREDTTLSTKSKIKTIILDRSEEKTWHDVYTNVIHVGRESSSKIQVYGLVFDEASITHRGLAKVYDTAHKSSTNINSKMLILGEKAKANSIPMLEIHTCRIYEAKHSTSLSRIDENQLFYLRTRGLNIDESKNLIIKGFLEKPLSEMNKYSREFIEDYLKRSLTHDRGNR